ncbi:hypothetical protein JCM18382A_16480 [Bradyrhizobium sp. 17-4]
MHVGGDLQQQSHDEEFGGADAKGTGGQGKDCERHVSLRRVRIPQCEIAARARKD